METDFLNVKFLIWALVLITLTGFIFEPLIDFYDFQTFGPLEITKVIFYMVVNGMLPIVMALLGLVTKLIGIDAVEVNYQVRYYLSYFITILFNKMLKSFQNQIFQPSWKEHLANLTCAAFLFVMSYWLFTAKFIMHLISLNEYVVLSSIIVQTILLHIVYHTTFMTGYIWLNELILKG